MGNSNSNSTKGRVDPVRASGGQASPRSSSGPQSERKDPRTSSIQGPGLAGNLLGSDPTRHYVWASANDEVDFNVDYYEGMGYELERRSEGGIRVLRGSSVKEGEPLKFRGLVLMSCSEEQYQWLRENGPDGRTGRALQRALQQKIAAQGLQEGSNSPYYKILSETQELQTNIPTRIVSG